MTNKKITTLGYILAYSPLLLVTIMLVIAHTAQQKFDLDKCVLAYNQITDKEKFLAEVYPNIKDIDEASLPPHLMSFVLKVKTSQFCK
jgi:hypothetical protein